jgi:hypothetical protein
MRFINKESKPLKLLVRDTLVVYFSVLVGNFIVNQIKPTIADLGAKDVVGGSTAVFTDNPDF